MSSNFKGLTDHPADRKKLSKIKLSDGEAPETEAANWPFLTLDPSGRVVINVYEDKLNKYIEVVTSFDLTNLEDLSDKQLDEVAKALLTGHEKQITAKYDLLTVEIPVSTKLTITGRSTVKELEIGIYASSTEDETALHYLLDKVRSKIE